MDAVVLNRVVTHRGDFSLSYFAPTFWATGQQKKVKQNGIVCASRLSCQRMPHQKKKTPTNTHRSISGGGNRKLTKSKGKGVTSENVDVVKRVLYRSWNLACDGFKFIAIGDDMQTLDNTIKQPFMCSYLAFLFFSYLF